MFAKRQSALAATAGAAPTGRLPKLDLKLALAVFKKPPVAVGAAGLLLLGTVALFLTVLGDPRAGTPTARVSLHREAPVEAPDGTAARPKLPSSKRTSTSTVGLPRLSRICRA